MKKIIVLIFFVQATICFGQNSFVESWSQVKLSLKNRTEVAAKIFSEGSEDVYIEKLKKMKQDYQALEKALLKSKKLNKASIKKIARKNSALTNSLREVITNLELNLEINNKKILPFIEQLKEVEKQIKLSIEKYNLDCETSNVSELKFPINFGETLLR